MGLNKGWISALAGTFFLWVFLVSCEDDLNTTIGEGVIPGEPFISGRAEYDVFAYNRSSVAVQTNRLPLYQIGVYDDPVFGRREAIVTSQIAFQNLQGDPVFGNYSQDLEDLPEASRERDTIPENETVKEVLLYLPYQIVPGSSSDRDGDGVPDELERPEDRDDPNSDQDNDGLTDLEESILGTNPFDPDTDGDGINDADDETTLTNTFANAFALDSIFSRRLINNPNQQLVGEEFTLKVERSTFFLRNLDPNTNFEEAQEYLSNTNIPSFTEGNPLFEGTVTIDNEQIVTFNEDDPDTDENESLTINTDLSLPPGVQVALDPQFFQENILDKEGDFELFSQSNLADFIRGLHISIIPNNEDLMILFNLLQANITITYEFDDFVVDDDNPAGTIEKVERAFTLNFLQNIDGAVRGNAVNTFIDAPLPSDIIGQLDNPTENASRLFLKGGSGTFSELRLFNEDAEIANDIIADIKANDWVINEANLVFNVDRSRLDLNGGTIEPPRLYLFNAENNTPLFNVLAEPANLQSPLDQFLDYDGILERDSEEKGIKYTVRITEYLNDIIVRDSTNAPLRLTLTSNVGIGSVQEAEATLGERVDLPLMNTINPLGTVLFGNNVLTEEEDKKLKLQIFYTEID